MEEKLKKILGDKTNLYLDDCLSFILSLKNNLQPLHIDKYVIETCLRAGLIVKEEMFYVLKDIEKSIDHWDWVKDFAQEFINIGVDKHKIYPTQLKGRMKKFITYHINEGNFFEPKEILRATRLYCKIKADENLFAIREPRYFIFKGRVNESDLYDYLIKIRELENQESSNKNKISNIHMI